MEAPSLEGSLQHYLQSVSDRRHRHFGPLLRPQEESRRSAQDDKVLSSEGRPGVDLLQAEPLLNHSKLTEPRLSSVPGPGKQSLHQLPATCTGVFRGNPSISRRSTSTATSATSDSPPSLSPSLPGDEWLHLLPSPITLPPRHQRNPQLPLVRNLLQLR